MRGPRKSCTVRYPGEGEPRSHAHSGILVMRGAGSHAQSGILVRGPREPCSVRYPGKGPQEVMLSQVSG